MCSCILQPCTLICSQLLNSPYICWSGSSMLFPLHEYVAPRFVRVSVTWHWTLAPAVLLPGSSCAVIIARVRPTIVYRGCPPDWHIPAYINNLSNLYDRGLHYIKPGYPGLKAVKPVNPALKKGVPLKDAWARIEPHGRELRRMGAHGSTWTRTTVKEHAVAGAGFKAETLRHWTGVSKKLLMMTHINVTRNSAAWTCTPANGNAPSAWTRIASCNPMQ